MPIISTSRGGRRLAFLAAVSAVVVSVSVSACGSGASLPKASLVGCRLTSGMASSTARVSRPGFYTIDGTVTYNHQDFGGEAPFTATVGHMQVTISVPTQQPVPAGTAYSCKVRTVSYQPPGQPGPIPTMTTPAAAAP